MTGYPFDLTYAFAGLTAGQDNYLVLPCPASGTVTKLIVNQAAGTASGFTADLYNSRLADPANSALKDARGAVPKGQELYRVAPTLTAANNARLASSSLGAQYPFQNQDPDALGRGRYLVLKVKPTAAGDFEVALAGFNPSTA